MWSGRKLRGFLHSTTDHMSPRTLIETEERWKERVGEHQEKREKERGWLHSYVMMTAEAGVEKGSRSGMEKEGNVQKKRKEKILYPMTSLSGIRCSWAMVLNKRFFLFFIFCMIRCHSEVDLLDWMSSFYPVRHLCTFLLKLSHTFLSRFVSFSSHSSWIFKLASVPLCLSSLKNTCKWHRAATEQLHTSTHIKLVCYDLTWCLCRRGFITVAHPSSFQTFFF